jgi:hypothetical protein
MAHATHDLSKVLREAPTNWGRWGPDVLFPGICAFDARAAECADDGQWSFLCVGAPLKIAGGTGAPANPVAVK